MDEALREYKAIVWTPDPTKAGTRVTVLARDYDEAERLVRAQFEGEIVMTMWNEADANRIR